MARVPSFAPTGQTVRPFATAVRKLAFAGRSCANCGSPDIRPSQSRNALDILLACLFLTPFRCRFCRERFYRVWRPGMLRPDPPVASLLVMPARHDVPIVDPLLPPPIIEPEPLPSPRTKPRLMPPGRRGATVNAAFIERLEAGMRSPRPLPDAPPAVILIFENDLSIRKLLRRLLERRGYTTVEVERTGNLKAELKNRLADLLVIDVSDHEVSLQDLITLGRAHPGLKILALSVDAPQDNEIPDRLVTLPKPFSLDRFVECVDRLVKR
jgi:CheY-like chemotaxis protein